ncbi:MAG: HlyD family secretion protein [Dongiaceae bacterium]|jgi:HlyD family secretion protein
MIKNGKFAFIIGFALLGAIMAGGYIFWHSRQAVLPEYIVSGNGRIEAEETHVATKYPGRVVEVVPEEGDFVKEGQIIARIEVQDIEAQRTGAKAKLAAAKNAVVQAQAEITHREAELELAEAEVKSAQSLVGTGVSRELFEKRKATAKTAQAALNVSKAGLSAAENQVEMAQAEIDRLSIMIEDAVLKAPMSGRVQYRLAEAGEVLSAGTRVITILDLENVYMTVFLPAGDIGKIRVGSEARIVLDALPDIVIPASVSFISSEAQFTPREVETREEREKLMFRVKLRIPKSLLAAHIEKVRTGLPGMGYVMLGEGQAWPQSLTVNVRDTKN